MQITKLREKLKNHEVSALQLAEKVLESIDERDKDVDSYLYVNKDITLKMANDAQKRIDNGEDTPLLGIPIGLKDILCTTDMPTTCASRMLENYTPPYDAFVVQKLRKAGAVFCGKLNMDEFAMGSSTATSYYKKTKNPYDLNRVPGGSSGGSAASVAAGLCLASLGSDTGGSIRQPASFCGVTGLRPTYGMVSRSGCVAFASSLDQIGPIATSARDCADVLSVIAGTDPKDATSLNSKPLNFKFGESIKGKKLGLIADLMGDGIDPETISAVNSAVEFYRSCGAEVELFSFPMQKYAIAAYFLISSAEATANLAKFDGVRYGHISNNQGSFEDFISQNRAEGFGDEVKRRILLGSYALCSGYYDDYYKKAVCAAREVAEQYNTAFQKYDAILSPASPAPAFRFDEVSDDPTQMYLADSCTVSAALAALPSLTTTCGYSKTGLPIGLMITGGRWQDAEILALADTFEQNLTRQNPKVFADWKEKL